MRKVGAFTIQPDPQGICGTHYWAYFYNDPPMYEVFEFLGKDPIHNMYFFESRKSGVLFMRHGKHLISKEFKPFLLNLDRMDKALAAGKKEEKN